jgi:hypothetical protein
MGKRFEGYSTNTFGARVGAARKYLQDYNAGGAAGVGQMSGDIMGDPRRTGGAFNDPSGTPIHGPRTTVTLNNGQQVTVNSRVAEQYKGFFNDLAAAGAPVHSLGGFGFRGGNPSQHPGGMAVDWAQSGRNRMSPDVQRWISQNPAVLNQLETKWGMSGGEHWRNPDTGHFSIQNIWGTKHLEALAKGTPIDGSNAHKSAEAIRSQMPNIGAAIGGTAIDDSRSRSIRGSLEAIRQGRRDDLMGGGRFTMPRPGQKDPIGDAERGLKLHPGKSFGVDPDVKEYPRSFEERASYDLLGHARQAGLVGPALNHKVTGSAHLKIDVNGPRGTEAKMAKMDGMFKTVQLSRGRAMPPASQQG